MRASRAGSFDELLYEVLLLRRSGKLGTGVERAPVILPQLVEQSHLDGITVLPSIGPCRPNEGI
jgi:hypothetical protein